jgi:hypothetical protein
MSVPVARSSWSGRYFGFDRGDSTRRGGSFWTESCCVEQFDEAEVWQDLMIAIEANDPFKARQVLSESRGRVPAFQILMFALRRNERVASGEIVQILLDAGACDDVHLLEHARETAVELYEHDKCQDWNKRDDSYDGGKFSHAPWELENYFIEIVLVSHRIRCEARASFRTQQQLICAIALRWRRWIGPCWL